MRERLLFHTNDELENRITPAYAGKTEDMTMCMRFLRDHPRICGKDLIIMVLNKDLQGSPPHMRERLHRNIHNRCNKGITPAYAGKTQGFEKFRQSAKDHPRVCGKDYFFTLMMSLKKGSPPRIRERPSPKSPLVRGQRITPAYAGKTDMSRVRQESREDHPRVCGKDCNLNNQSKRDKGSPPRMRERPSSKCNM